LPASHDRLTSIPSTKAGQDVDAFETFITRDFEEPGQKAIEKLIAGSRMTADDWRRIARFVVTQDLRTPQDFIEWYARLQQNIQESLEAAIRKLPERIAQRQAGLSPEDDAPDAPPDFLREVLKVSIDRSQPKDGMVPVRADIRSRRSETGVRDHQHLGAIALSMF
jgi:hypothetical protein